MPAPEPIPDLLKSANEASARGFALWVTFLTVEIYLAIAAGTTTHKQLLLEDPVKLPLLSVDLPLFAFYVFAPLLFVCLHLYVLAQLYLLARKLRVLDDEMRAARMVESDRGRQRAQLDTFVLTQLLVGAPTSWAVRWFLRLAVWLTLLVLPVLLLVLMQLRFLPYHDEPTTWVQRIALLLDLGLIWVMWPAIVVGVRVSGRTGRRSWGRGAMAAFCVALALFSVLVATVPKEWIERRELELDWAVHGRHGDRAWWPTWALSGWLPRNLALDDQPLVGLDEDALAKRKQTLRLRDRDLRHAALDRADLRKADLTGALLQGASLVGALLQGASLDRARLQGASLVGAGVWRAYLQGSNTTLADGRRLDAAPMPPGDARTLIATVKEEIPDGPRRSQALERLSILAGAVPAERALAKAAAASNTLAQRGWDEAKDDPAVASLLGTLGCQQEDPPYVARGLLRRIRTVDERTRPYARLLAKALRESGCAGARGLTAGEMTTLGGIAASAPEPDAAPEANGGQNSEAARSQ